MKKIYEWKLDSFAKGIKPNKAVKELERIENLFGSLTPEHILEASKPDDSLFHKLFTWDDTEAANNYRLQQARKIINNIEVVIISNGEERSIPVYEIIVHKDGRMYKHIDNFTLDDIEQVKERTVRELNILKVKLSLYKQFDIAVTKIDEAVATIEEVKM